MQLDDGIPAIPLWINGRAWLGAFERFIDVRESDGSVRYRVPQCGAHEIEAALASARAAQPTWANDAATRQRLTTELASLLDQFTGDFARLISRETGKEQAAARDEVAAAVSALQKNAGAAAGSAEVRHVNSSLDAPLASIATGLSAAFTAGASAIITSNQRAPSAVFALAELSARAGFPSGAICLLHGDETVGEQLAGAIAAR